MKTFLTCIIAILLVGHMHAQPIIKDGSLTTIILNTDNSTRHNNFFYNDYKLTGLRVISVHQANTTYDLIFYVDNQGKTQYKSKAHTGPMNKTFNYIHRYDSFNPYGSTDIRQALFAGIMNTIFKYHVMGWRFR